MNLKFIKNTEKKKILKKLNEQFGIEELHFLLIESGKEKIRAFSGHLSKKEILKLNEILDIELIGLYLMKYENNEIRLSFDSIPLISSQIKKNILEISEQQMQEWIKGHNLNLSLNEGTYVIKHENDFLGCGKSNGSNLINYVPKDRRLKK